MLNLRTDLLRVTVSPAVGAGIADFSLKGPSGFFFPLMRRAAVDEGNSSLLSSFFMAPWVNRIRGGQFSFGDRRHAIRTNTADGMAQHGDVRKRPWALVSQTDTSATLEFDSRTVADSNWPWSFSSRAVYTLTPSAVGGTLRIELSVCNTDSSSFPAACGHHPYFSRRLWNDADEVRLTMPVAAEYALKDGCAVAAARATELSQALRTSAPIPNRHIDAVFAHDPSRPNTSTLQWPASGVRLDIRASSNLAHWILYAPHERPMDGARPSPLSFIAVEPQSQVNDALNLAAATGLTTTGTVSLNPGETLDTVCEFVVARE